MVNDSTSNFHILCCPRCQDPLDQLTCTPCELSFRETLGIPDLRWPRPSPAPPEERALIAEMVEAYPTSSFEQLVALRFQDSKLPKKILANYHNYSASPQERSRQMLDMFQERLLESFARPASGVALDLGCGVGASSVVLSSQFDTVIGIDIDLISLILARKFIEEQGISNITLVQSYAQKLPLPTKSVDYAVAQNVLEHLFEVETALRELRRVLADGGLFCGDSRNRFDLLFPEPHAKLRWVGVWPRRWQAWYVRQFRRVKYDHTHLLSLPELTRFARRVFGASAQVTFPLGAAYGRSPRWDRLIRFIERIPLLRSLCLFFFPSHLLLAQAKPE